MQDGVLALVLGDRLAEFVFAGGLVGKGDFAALFAGVEPANTTYYVGSLIPEVALVEVELDAAVDLPK